MHPPLRILRRRWRILPQHGVIALSAVLIAGYGASTFWSLQRAREEALRDAGSALESMARSAETGTSRSLFEIDAMLIGIGRIAATVLPTTQLGDPSLKTVLRQFNEQSLAVSDILILNNQGRELNRANPTPDRAGDYAGRPFVKAHRPGAPPSLFIGAPGPSPAGGGWSVMLSRPLMRNGVMVGIIAAEVPVASFTGLYDALQSTGGARIELLSDDGSLVAGDSLRGAASGRAPVFTRALLAQAVNDKAGVSAAPARPDREGGLRIFRRVAGRPLIVSVSLGRHEILSRWYVERDALLAGFVLFALTAAGLAWLADRALSRAQRAAANLRRSEARLKRQSTLLQSTLDNIGEGLSVFNARGWLIARNFRFCELLDLPADLPTGTALHEILMAQARRGDFGDVEPQAEVARRVERFYCDLPKVAERVTETGRTLQIRRSAMPGGAVVSVYSDVTEIKAGERRILQARSQAELANHSKSEFLANMSHELRTPLNAIIGFTEIISRELFGPIANEKYLEYMRDVHASSLHLLSIINDVLDMSKIEAGKLELAKEPVTLQNVIGDVIRIVHERAGSRGIELIPQLVDDPVIIWADERAMKQVFLNLLSNAIKFSEDRNTVTIRVAVEHRSSAVLEVEDHGIGMDEEEQRRALQPFGQATSSTTRNYGGTGLGLPITKGLIEAHGGALTINSRPGLGTIVRIVLPTYEAHTVPGASMLSEA
jgi:signal transduction histidine kinase